MRDPVTGLDVVARLDDLPRRAAAADPGGVAIRTDRGAALTFADLDRRIDRCARRVRAGLGAPGRVVAVASVLDPAFAVAYYGALRAGMVVLPVNPLLREQGVARLLDAADARLVIAPGGSLRRAAGARAVLVWDGDGDSDADADRASGRNVGCEADRTTDRDRRGDRAERGAGPRPAGDHQDAPAAPDDVASIHFTSGTTGDPRGVRQTHRNLAVNAAQTAYAHRLRPGDVTANHLPTYHPMHLNSALHAGATQVLCTDPDPVASLRTANAVRAGTYYGLPVRLSRLAADPSLPELRLETVRAVFSGGSALPLPATVTLGDHFGIPVLQGYGLAETSPMTHCDRPHRPKPGSCGPPVPGTECRIVDLASGRPAAPGARGEIQVRGPQLMRGYLGEPDGAATDPDGWFATGDVGCLDDDGYLFVVDRLKDVFKCDNWLVSPQEIEAALLADPEVADCAVVDCPDPFSGALPVALVVPGGARSQAALDAIAERVNAGLPSFQHIRHVRGVREITRSAGGKIRRAELRQWVADLLAGEGWPRPVPSPPPDTTTEIHHRPREEQHHGDPDQHLHRDR